MEFYEGWSLHFQDWIWFPRFHVNSLALSTSCYSSHWTEPMEQSLEIKTTPKIRDFLWRALWDVLAVKERLQSTGTSLDSICQSCDSMVPESICHVLFSGDVAKETWKLSNIPLPFSVFSSNSVFSNIHHLLTCSQKSHLYPSIRFIFPWIIA